jgi:hypothetical protein
MPTKSSDKKRSTSKLAPAIIVNDLTTIQMEEEHTDDEESDKEQGVGGTNQTTDVTEFGEHAAPTELV